MGGQRLARAGFAHNAGNLIAADLQADILHGKRPVGAWRQTDSKILERKQRHQPLPRGLSASFNPSPMKFSASTVMTMQRPGNTVVHQATHIATRELPIMLPQLIRLGSPKPRKLSADSVRMALPTI